MAKLTANLIFKIGNEVYDFVADRLEQMIDEGFDVPDRFQAASRASIALENILREQADYPD